MRYLLLLLVFLPSLFNIYAQTFQVTEISPKKVGDIEEWFEFSVSGVDHINLSDYQFSNGSTRTYDFENIIPGTGAAHIQDLEYQIDGVGYFYTSKSPMSLSDSGSEINILDREAEILHKAVYPKTKGGTRKAYKWAEIWNWSPDFQQFIPMLYHNDQDPMYVTTSGMINHHLPTPGNRFELKIDQIDFLNDTITVRMYHGPKKINLKQISIKHNGTMLWASPDDFWLERDEKLVLQVGVEEFQQFKTIIHTPKRASVQQSSGSIELILHTGTSWEQVADFVCWQEDALSKTETNRAEKYRVQKDWAGPCVVADNLEGLRREKDTNQAIDFVPLVLSADIAPPIAIEPEPQSMLEVVLADEVFMAAAKEAVPLVNTAPQIITPAPANLARKIILPKTVRERLKRNLGLIWNWREAPWAGAVGSISDGAIDRNSERFLVKFGAP